MTTTNLNVLPMFSVGVNTAVWILYHEGHANRKKPKWPTTVALELVPRSRGWLYADWKHCGLICSWRQTIKSADGIVTFTLRVSHAKKKANKQTKINVLTATLLKGLVSNKTVILRCWPSETDNWNNSWQLTNHIMPNVSVMHF